MPHSYSRIWVHAILGVKYRRPLIQPGIRGRVHLILKEQLEHSGCPVRIINGIPCHVHLLFRLNPQLSLAELMKRLKGASSRQINEAAIMPQPFAWQVGYGAFSVGEPELDRVIRYIQRQEEHHHQISFDEEYQQLITQYKADESSAPPP